MPGFVCLEYPGRLTELNVHGGRGSCPTSMGVDVPTCAHICSRKLVETVKTHGVGIQGDTKLCTLPVNGLTKASCSAIL